MLPTTQQTAFDGGYTQTYLIRNPKHTESKPNIKRDILFRCGDDCHVGNVELCAQISLHTLPDLIPCLVKQQDRLSYYCEARNMPPDGIYTAPLSRFCDKIELISKMIMGDRVTAAIKKGKHLFKWIDDEDSPKFFELSTKQDQLEIEAIASKTYAPGGLVIVTIYFDRSFYFVVNECEGDQPLCGTQFPNVALQQQGLQLIHFRDPELDKLVLWYSSPVERPVEIELQLSDQSQYEIERRDCADEGYVQTFIIHGANGVLAERNAFFRFGSWCYSGAIELPPDFTLQELSSVIPRLRMQQQQNLLRYVCEADRVPVDSPYFLPLKQLSRAATMIREEIAAAEQTLSTLVARLQRQGLGNSIMKWLDGGGGPQTYFEFTTNGSRDFKGMDLIASKIYHRGLVLIVIYSQKNYYVCVEDGENTHALLDHKFPDVSTKSRGYQLKTYSEESVEGFPELRKLCLWQAIDFPCSKSEEKKSPVANVTAEAKVEAKAEAKAEAKDCQFPHTAERAAPPRPPRHLSMMTKQTD